MYRLILTAWLALTALAMHAAGFESAFAAQQNFMNLRANGASEAQIYDALYKAWQELDTALKTNPSGTTDYTKAKYQMRELWPFLQAGAGWNSSQGSKNNATVFARAYIEVPLMDAFKGDDFVKDENYPTMAYFAASNTYNAGDYANAIRYFRAYLDTRDPKHRQNVFNHMAKACINLKDYGQALAVLEEASNNYTDDFNILSMAINTCIDIQDNASLQKFVTKALKMRPQDETLLNIQGKLHEEQGEYQKALNVYTKLKNMKPNNLTVAKHLAVNYYNLGVLNHNKAAMENNSSAEKKLMRQSQEFFQAAAATMEEILAAEPNSLKYMQALATAYSCMGQNKQLDDMNMHIASIGGATVEQNARPTLMAFAGNTLQAPAPAQKPAAVSVAQNAQAPVGGPNYGDDIPLYSQYAKEYVEARLKKWQAKDSYETVAEYQARVNEQSRKAEFDRLLKEAEKEYVRRYTAGLRFNDMTLQPYDADNGVFLVESKFGQLIVPVPRDNNEAKVFESSWGGMQFKNPDFYVSGDRLMLSGLTFVTPTGKSYRYDGDRNLNYVATQVDVNFDPISTEAFAQNAAPAAQSRVKTQTVSAGGIISEVDKDIPEAKKQNEKTFAVILGNEDYAMVAKVPGAVHDAEVFAQYCEKTLGLPKQNVRLYQDASYGVMLRAMKDIREIADAFDGGIKVIFYYAGHGIPNESTKDAFLLPVDADGTSTDGCYSLKKLYGELGALNAESTVVFLDACFSGAQREGGMLASARGVALKPKKQAPEGNMVVISAASDDETAFPYTEKGHGLFTFFLLKKLQESKGNATLGEIAAYVQTNVKQQSVLVNRKAQNPSVVPSTPMLETWKNIRLNNK